MAIEKRNSTSGKPTPDHFTQISFYINLAVSVYFLCLNLLSLVALNNFSVIEKYKQLSVQDMIEKRGNELGFETGEFQSAMNQYYVFTLVLFIPIALGLFLNWKKNTKFYPLITISFLLIVLGMLLLLGPTFFWNDSTFFDKILLLILFVNSTIYRGLLKKELRVGSISFFDEA